MLPHASFPQAPQAARLDRPEPGLNIDAALKTALRDGKSGRTAEAERLYAAVLSLQPHHAEANHKLGVLALDQGRVAAAIPHLTAALKTDPGQPRHWMSLVEGLVEAGRLAEAGSILARFAEQGFAGTEVAALKRAFKAKTFARAKTAHEAGRRDETEALCGLIVGLDPRHAGSLHLLGLVAYEAGRLDIAGDLIALAIAQEPKLPALHVNLGNVHLGLGRLDEAAECYRRAGQLAPRDADIQNNLGAARRKQGRFEEAIGHFRQALKREPRYALAHNNLGATLMELGRHAQAVPSFDEAIRLDPLYVDAHDNLGIARFHLGDLDGAVASYRHALRLHPGSAGIHNNLANALLAQDRPEEALAAYDEASRLVPDFAQIHANRAGALRSLKRLDEAAASCEEALRLRPDCPDTLALYGQVLQDQHRFEEAVAAYHRSLCLRPTCATTMGKRAALLRHLGRIDECLVLYEQCLRLAPDNFEFHNNLGTVLKDMGRLEDAIVRYDDALRLRPDPAIHSNRLLTKMYHEGASAEDLAEDARAFGRTFADPHLRRRPFANTRDPERRLRVGFVSADFNNHSVNRFFEPALDRLDRGRLELFVYSNNARNDDVTERLTGKVDGWRDIRDMPDDEAADLVEADRIDILIDLSGHTAGNRLTLFARKPAPIQALWIGYPATTGMAAMDYRITDAHAEPPGLTDHLHTETLWRMPHTAGCYAGGPNRPAIVERPPSDENGYVTFGCFNNFARVSDVTLATWARLLDRVGDARLMLEIMGVDKPKFRARIESRLTRFGLPLDRVILEPRKASNQYVLYNRIDVALDPFPANGGTTSNDTLWMGVPFVTLAGNQYLSRIGLTTLTNVGLTDLIATTTDQYVEIAARLASDRDWLRAVRTGLSDTFQASPMMDNVRLARDLEASFRQMWHRWLAADAARPEAFETPG